MGWELGPQCSSTQRRDPGEEVTGPWVVWFHQWIHLLRTPSLLQHWDVVRTLEEKTRLLRGSRSRGCVPRVCIFSLLLDPTQVPGYRQSNRSSFSQSLSCILFSLSTGTETSEPVNWHLWDRELKSVFLLRAGFLRYFVSVTDGWLTRGLRAAYPEPYPKY